ncbi:PREDICTED: uncharacterized protein LOC107333989 [Acropora digitifera]|uniref:uncharacterized protein LOC107333989 n=1 Tax=Acropora digitifera TaxID=70779 RepID=UPI00077B07F6|nr:PREDICTED: uncharacterized protein LOC107333989 [Acropora digitifera]XP_029191438.1 uncharacterized protein LOC114957996 [Acropora millepora]
MKSFLFIILANFLLAESRVFLGQKDKWIRSFAEPKKTFIPSSQQCSSNDDCRADECCFELTGSCFEKYRRGQSCSPDTSCSCADGLSCEVFMKFGSEEFYRCMKKEEYRD